MRGQLRIYLGAAPGVGKTFAMLGEARRRCERGTDVVIGLVETHDRARTAEQLAGLEVLPRRITTHRGVELTELDVDAVLARRPAVVAVDELAHTNAPGSRHPKRWQDIDEILDAGIDVLSTVNIQHLESLNDVVEQITGIHQQETVPDAVVRRANQIELVDMAPEALRRRLAHGNVYPSERIDAALSNYFRVGNLTALRELALLWLADQVDEGLERYRAQHGIHATWEARERILVTVSGGSESETIIRRAARIADRTPGAEFLTVHVRATDGLVGAAPEQIQRWRVLTTDLGGTFHSVVGDDAPEAVLEFARSVNATQIVVGTSRRGRLARLLREGVGERITRGSGPIDVHLVTHGSAGSRRSLLPGWAGGLSLRRRLAGALVVLVGLPLLTGALAASRSLLTLSSILIIYLLFVIAVALVGGLWPALAAAVAASLLANWYFTPPLYTFTVGDPQSLLSLGAMLVSAVAVSVVVERAERRSREAARSRAEAQFLVIVAGDVLAGIDALPALLARVREAFGVHSVSLLEHTDEHGWTLAASAGPDPPLLPSDGDADVAVDERLHLAVSGRTLTASDRHLLAAVASQAAVALRQGRLAATAATAGEFAEASSFRAALLAAVSHDLRTPLSAIKASATALESPGLELSDADVTELLAGITTSADQLTDLVANLLDMTRLTSGALNPLSRAVGLEEIVPNALRGLPPDLRLEIDVAADLPAVHVDPGLVERVVANLVSNAVRHGGSTEPVCIRASAHSGRVELRVVDHGPGVQVADRDRMFQPFQRQGDRDTSTGVGLGLAVARGFAQAVGGSLSAEDTPGGGLTMVLSLPAVTDSEVPPADAPQAPAAAQ